MKVVPSVSSSGLSIRSPLIRKSTWLRMPGGVERPRFGQQLVLAHMLLVHDERADNPLGEVGPVLSEFGHQVIHRAAGASRTAQQEDRFCTFKRAGNRIVEVFGFRLALPI